jgi:hypothetical protein
VHLQGSCCWGDEAADRNQWKNHALMDATSAQGAQVAVLGRPYRRSQQAPVQLFLLPKTMLPVCAAMARFIHGLHKTM